MTHAFTEICQNSLPLAPWMHPRTSRFPGVNPLTEDWLQIDEAYAAQMAYRDWLIATQTESVHQISDAAIPAAQEVLTLVLEEIKKRDDFDVTEKRVTRPDGVNHRVDFQNPLITLGGLVQDDFCIMQKQGAEDVLTGAILCFPASWTLSEKFLRPMRRIHQPVAEITEVMSQRVQRIFDGIKVGNPVWRMNYLTYSDPDLHQPRLEADRRSVDDGCALWLRCERQCLRRLPKSNALIFSIHSYIIPTDKLTDEERMTLPQNSDIMQGM